MLTTDIISVNGYPVPILLELSGSESLVVLISHGFTGSRHSSSAAMAARTFAEHGIGSIRFDFPSHGDNPMPLRIANCLDTIAAVEEYLHEKAPQAEIAYFSTSFGGYMNLIYCTQRPHRGHRSLLRCAAVHMPQTLQDILSDEQKDTLSREGTLALTIEEIYSVVITDGFLDDLASHDVFSLFSPASEDRFLMIHGTADDTVHFPEAEAFSERFNLPLIPIPGAGHDFKGPGEMEQLLAETIAFFLA